MPINHYQPKRMYDGETEFERQDRKKAIREETERLMAEWLAKGGEVQKCGPPKVTLEPKFNPWRQYPKKEGEA